MARYISICGSGRSGSTLVNLLLGSHPGVISLGETTNLLRSVTENRQCTCRQHVKTCVFWNDIRREILSNRGIDIFERPEDFPVSLQPDRQAVVGHFVHYQRLALAWLGREPLTRVELVPPGGIPTRKIVDNIFHLYDTVRAITGCQAVVDSSKLPLRMKWLWMNRPSQVKALYVVRDGRAVLSSNIRRGWSTKSAVFSWIKAQTSVRLMLQRMQEDSWLLVRYEDLCNNPQGELRRICQFLSLEFSEEMLDFRKSGHHDIDGNRMRFDTSKEIVNRETWRQELECTDLQIFERFAGSINRRLGYSD